MNHLNFLKNRLETVQTELQKLISDRTYAGISTTGDYDLQIKRLKEERSRLLTEIQEEESRYKTPDEAKIFCYVVVSTKENVKRNIGDKCFLHFEEDRYHSEKLKEWRPYRHQSNIEEILADIRQSYNFTPIYLDGDIEEKHWRNLDKEIHWSVSVIDLFSLNEGNKMIAAKFDNHRAGVLLPLCRSLKIELVDLYRDIRRSIFKSLTAGEEDPVPSAYYFDISTVERFQSDIRRLFRQKFPIKNQAISDSDVRDMKLGLQ